MLRLVTPNAAPATEETVIDTRPAVDYEQRIRERQERENASREQLAAIRPPWAKALIVAELVRFEWRIKQSSIEHREKYSMGHGYYLKASTRYSDGWIVRKTGGACGSGATLGSPAWWKRR